MSNYNFKMDLSKLDGFGVVNLTGKSGKTKKCVVIPIEDNHIFEGNKGVYLDLVCVETQNSQYGDSHFVSRSKTKEEQEQEKKTNERLKLPILGNLKPFETKSSGNYSGGEEYSGVGTAPSPAQALSTKEESDLPF